jgi:ABC-type hemin transport system ATPase subunit
MKVRDMLVLFLFRGDDVDKKKVKVLSGGERNALRLCKIVTQLMYYFDGSSRYQIQNVKSSLTKIWYR